MKVIFDYEYIYDEVLTEMLRKKISSSDEEEAKEFTKKFEKYWKPREKQIIAGLEKCSGLKFKRNEIKCYFVNHFNYRAISNPLTIKISGTFEDMRDILIHELIHNLFIDHDSILLPLIKKTYEDEDMQFKTHVAVLLVERKATETLFGKRYFSEFEKKDRMLNFKFEWLEVDKFYPRYTGSIIKFLKNENLD